MNQKDPEIKVLDPLRDQAQWQALVSGLESSQRDAFLLPGYARVYEKVYGGRSGLFCIDDAGSRILHIFLRRPVHTLPFFALLKTDAQMFDIITPEYSGPVFSGHQDSRKKIWEVFEREFPAYCRNQNIVAEFGRINPYYNSGQDFLTAVNAQENRQVVYLDLSLSEREIWDDFSKGNKSSIKKAQKAGITVRQSTDPADIAEFYRLYASTMERNQAASFYYFSPDFFQEMFSFLRGAISLFTATYQGKIVAASIFLHEGDYVHYYFSGSDMGFFELCPNNLLIFEAAAWARKEGYKILSLGGGYHNSGQDSLFRFKSSFSPRSATFYTYSLVHEPQLYRQLVSAYCEFNNIGEEGAKGQRYFPFYRK